MTDLRIKITMEDLKVVEGVCRKDPKVIEQCGILGIPPEDMDKVYCDRTFSRALEIQAPTDQASLSLDHRLRRALWQ